MDTDTHRLPEAAEPASEKPLAEQAFEEAYWRLYTSTPANKISVGEVARLAGYNRGTFYLHYQCLDDVLARIEGELLERIQACVADCMARLEQGADPEAVMADVLALYEDNASRLSVLMGSKGDPAFTEALKDELKPLWARYVLEVDAPDNADESVDAAGEDRLQTRSVRERVSDAKTDLLLEFSLSGALFMLRQWMDNPRGVSAEQMLHIVYHQVLGK